MKHFLAIATASLVAGAAFAAGDMESSHESYAGWCTDKNGVINYPSDAGYDACTKWKAKRNKEMPGMMPSDKMKKEMKKEKSKTEKRDAFSDPTSGGY